MQFSWQCHFNVCSNQFHCHINFNSVYHRKLDRVLRNENVVFYCISKRKPSAAYNQQATKNIISIMKHGKLPADSKCEAFTDGERIAGGDRSNFPDLPVGKLREQMMPVPLFARCKRWRRSRDGCRGQYQGRGAFYGWQTMTRRHEMECEDDRKVKKQGTSHYCHLI